MKKYQGYKIDKLRTLCEERGLSTDGKKDELLNRLSKYDNPIQDIFSQPNTNAIANKFSEASNKFYLHINAANLSNYFAFGCFYPLALEESEIYKRENRTKDILSFWEEYIIIAKSPINRFRSSDVLIEILLNGIEVISFEKTGLYYVKEPIPISRVKAIFFKNLAEKSTFLSSIKTFPDTFIPSSICKIITAEIEKGIDIDIESIKLPKNDSLHAWKEKLRLFDKILGLFAFIKNSGTFYAEKENKFESHSSGFFSTLNLLNSVEELSKYKENVFLKTLIHYHILDVNSAQREIFKSIIEIIYGDKMMDIETAVLILEEVGNKEYLADTELLNLKQLTELLKKIDRLNISFKESLQTEIMHKSHNLPVLALFFLSKYPNKSRQNSDKQAVRNIFIEKDNFLPINIAEYILGILGIYYGYRNMVKEDTNLKFIDKNFEQLAANSQHIKFKLESYFDRFIIESIFQFSVTQKPLNEYFSFLNWGKEEKKTDNSQVLSDYQYEYINESFVIMGQEITMVIRRDKIDRIIEFISNQYSDKININSYLSDFFIKHFQLDKKYVLDVLKQNKGLFSINELEDVIKIDRKKQKK